MTWYSPPITNDPRRTDMTHHIDQLHPGMTASIAKTVTEADIILFAGVDLYILFVCILMA